jgi:hypothetical protein
MKTKLTLISLIFMGNLILAQSKHDALFSDTITWYGLDFSEARFVDEFAFKSADELKSVLFIKWNRTIVAEPDKYNISKFFNIPVVRTELGEVYNRNEKVDTSKIILDIHQMDYALTDEKVKTIISQYEVSGEGYGLVFIIENFCKLNSKGSMWVTYFHIPTKQVVFAKRMVGDAGGFGLHNYWMGSVYNVFEKSLRERPFWVKE